MNHQETHSAGTVVLLRLRGVTLGASCCTLDKGPRELEPYTIYL